MSGDAEIVVRNAAGAFETLVAALHRHHASSGNGCEDCRVTATAVLSTITTRTAAAQRRERYPRTLILPPRWVLRSPATQTTEVWDDSSTGVRVIRSEALQDDGLWWAHVSVSRRDRKVPSWTLMSEIKTLFLGDVEAYMVHPPKERYVNIHEGVLHWFACLDRPDGVLPDFTRGTGGL